MSDQENAAYWAFVENLRNKLKEIARRSQEEFGDVANRAWEIAANLAIKHGSDITVYFTEPARDTLIRHLYSSSVHFCEKKIRNSVRLERTLADEPDRYNRIIAAASSEKLGDPLHILMAEESTPDCFQPNPHDTEPAAYLYLLDYHDGSMRALADSLLISVPYCYHRRKRARELLKVQSSLFKGALHGVDLPSLSWRRCRAYRAAPETHLEKSIAAKLALE